MSIINIKRKNRDQVRVFRKTRTWSYVFMLLVVVLPVFLAGCNREPALDKAENAAGQSQAHYRKAIRIYQGLIAKGKDLDRLRFELGLLYYNHRDYRKAAQELSKAANPQARKYLAIAYYHLGDFTGAFEIFSKNPATDDETRYYWGLTAERLNLFDQALDIYRQIKSKDYSSLAVQQVNLIEKQANPANIKDISPGDYKLIAQSASQKEYPQAGALVLLADEKIEITPENTQVSEMRYLVKILNERGKEGFSETHIDYDTTYEKVELEYARTIRPDGTVVDVGSRHIRDVSKYLNFPLYSNAHVYIISFPEITEGAVIDYKIKIYRNELINKKDFVLPYPVQAGEPIIRANFSLALPKEKPLHIKLLNEEYDDFQAKLKPVISDKDGRVEFNWQFKGLPQILPESNMPPQVEINPTVLMSSFTGWDEIYAWWWDLARGRIKASEAIKDKVKNLIKDKATAEGKARAIYNFCAKEIRYVAVEYGQAGYQPHKAEDIFQNKYGDCKDQAILLVTMLKEAGFQAYPVLIPTKECYNLDENFPSMLFNHAIAAVELDNRLVFMDPTAETCSFGDLPDGDQGRQVMVFKENSYQIQDTPLYPANHNFLKQTLKIKADQDGGIDADRIVLTYGVYDQAQRHWLLYTPPELIGETLNEKIQAISIGAKLKAYDIKNLYNLNEPVILDYAFSGPEYLISAGPLRIVPQLSSLETALVAKDKRRYPLDLHFLDKKEIEFEIAIPEGFIVKYMPPDIDKDSPWMKFSAQYSLDGAKIHFRQIVELKKNLVPREEYPEFKFFFESLAKQIKQRIILEEKK